MNDDLFWGGCIVLTRPLLTLQAFQVRHDRRGGTLIERGSDASGGTSLQIPVPFSLFRVVGSYIHFNEQCRWCFVHRRVARAGKRSASR